MSYHKNPEYRILNETLQKQDIEIGELALASRKNAEKTKERSGVMLEGAKARTTLIMDGAYHPDSTPAQRQKEIEQGLKKIETEIPSPSTQQKEQIKAQLRKSAQKLNLIERTDDSPPLTKKAKEAVTQAGRENETVQTARREIAKQYEDNPDRTVQA